MNLRDYLYATIPERCQGCDKRKGEVCSWYQKQACGSTLIQCRSQSMYDRMR